MERVLLLSSQPQQQGRLKPWCKPLRAQAGDAVVKKQWDFWYGYSAHHCLHGDVCARLKRGQECFYGMRVNPVDLITGARPLPPLEPSSGFSGLHAPVAKPCNTLITRIFPKWQ